MNIDKATLIEALNASNLAKSRDIASLGGRAGPASGTSGPSASDRSAESSDAASKGLQDFTDKLGTGAGVFIDSFRNIGGKVMDVNLRLSDLTEEGGKFTKSMLGQVLGLERLGIVSGVAADAMSDVVKYAEKNVDAWRKLSDVGASFGNDVIAMDVAAKNMRLSTEDMADIVRKNTKDLAVLGGTVDGGAKVFTDFSRVFHESGVNEQLLQMGMNEKEINELLVLQATSTRNMRRMDDAAKEAEVKAAKELAVEMDAMARLTGKSRQEQMEAQRALKNDAQVQASVNAEIAKGGKDVEHAFGRAMAATATVGPEMQSLVKGVLAAGQLPVNATREQQQMFAQMGGESRALLKQASDAFKAGKGDEAERLTNQALVAAARSKELEQAQSRAKYGEESGMLLYSNLMNLRRTTDVANENAKAVGKNSLTTRELADFTVSEAKKEAEKRTGVTATVVAAENEGKKLSSAMANNLISPLNEKIGPGLLGFYNNTLKPRVGGRPGTTDYQDADTPRPLVRPGGNEAEIQRELERRNQRIPGSLDPRRNEPGGGGTLMERIGLGTVSLMDGVINISKSAKIEMLSRETGSLGMTGKLMEDFGSGTLAMLHGKESVVTEDQMKNLMNNVQAGSANQNMPQMLQQALGTLKTAMPSATKNAESMASDFQSVASTLSSDASLNDLLGALNQLNTKMNQLIDTHADVGSRQIRATKSNNANLFAR